VTLAGAFHGSTTILSLALRHKGISNTAEKKSSLPKQMVLTNPHPAGFEQHKKFDVTVLNFVKRYILNYGS